MRYEHIWPPLDLLRAMFICACVFFFSDWAREGGREELFQAEEVL